MANEQSPYLLQHAHNPVDWYPWGEEAFTTARKEEKPIFLSIGYSTCHWCHVMERESFADEEVAALLNEVFVPIKVDREERPDLDGIYMTVCQMMTGTGGWPLTVIMTPEGKPFFAGTYFPKETRFGRIGLVELAKKIKDIWENRREEVFASAQEITEHLQRLNRGPVDGDDLDGRVLTAGYEQLTKAFDERYGGFGTAPKFPTPHNLLFLLRYSQRAQETNALRMVEKTLRAMREGGIYDQLGYGFHRYSTDERWFAPHFEKMLYDQALLAMVYTEAYQISTERKAKEFYRNTAVEIFTYLLREMRSAEGGFYSAEDADSEGVEGKFYLWSEEEIKQVLSPKEAALICAYFQVSAEGNYRPDWSTDPGQARAGRNILYIGKSLDQLGAELGLNSEESASILREARSKLYRARTERVPPYKDDKILTDWNGLVLAALAKGAQAFADASYLQAAEEGADFFLRRMRDQDGRLFHRYRNGEAAIQGFLDDYAFFTWGLLELYEASCAPKYLQEAICFTDILVKHFYDPDRGGFFQTSDLNDEVLVRRKEIYDGAVPSGNSVAMLNLLRLGRMTGNPEYEAKAMATGRAFAREIRRSPVSHTQALIALDFGLGSSFEVVIAGPPEAEETRRLLDLVRREFIPRKVLLFHPTTPEQAMIEEIAPFTKELVSINGQATAYVCQNFQCRLPVTDPGKMMELLGYKSP